MLTSDTKVIEKIAFELNQCLTWKLWVVAHNQPTESTELSEQVVANLLQI